MLLSLRSLCSKLSPTERFVCFEISIEYYLLLMFSTRQAFRSFQTHNYKLHYFETPTNLKFAMTTDLAAGGIPDLLKSIYANVCILLLFNCIVIVVGLR
jgi:hypothetical protein